MSGGKPHDITDAEFNEVVLGSKLPVVVEFWSPKCVHCQRMANTVDALAKEFAGKVKVVKVNVLEHMESAAELGVRDIPAFYHVKDGLVVARTAGAMSKGKLKEELAL